MPVPISSTGIIKVISVCYKWALWSDLKIVLESWKSVGFVVILMVIKSLKQIAGTFRWDFMCDVIPLSVFPLCYKLVGYRTIMRWCGTVVIIGASQVEGHVWSLHVLPVMMMISALSVFNIVANDICIYTFEKGGADSWPVPFTSYM